ncbi:hypothetical protein SAY87_006239 [Trapa incisa]|uniref:Uncharacterized protein n=1 Tax=Trapa incisa TaxID=236973 RepID=A0AAN7KC32_9MYRT|nr:hypothetical protein SAY87_006239 [Trapa incisa]
MASSSSSSNKFYHIRSNSLPSRPHPVIMQLEKDLHSLRASETTCATSSLASKLHSLQDLHECADTLLSLPLVQKAFTQKNGQRWVDELLDGTLRLLDMCSTAKNGLLQTKDALQELLSGMRRRKGGENALADEIRKYLSLRKSVKKAMKKAVSSLKSRKFESTSHVVDDEAATFVSLLMEVEAASSAVLGSVTCLITSSRRRSSSCKSPSIISKLMHQRTVALEMEKADLNELAKQDIALESLVSRRTSKVHDLIQVEQLQNNLNILESDIENLEDGLESLSRRLIKSRVSLLNILSN